MKKIFPYLCVGFILTPLLVSAETNDTKTITLSVQAPILPAYEKCKKTALLHKERIMKPALREYREASNEITNRAKSSFEKISWYINTSYKLNSRKILNDKQDAMRAVSAKIAGARKTAQSTYQAEIALCELSNQETTKEKSASIVTKNRTN